MTQLLIRRITMPARLRTALKGLLIILHASLFTALPAGAQTLPILCGNEAFDYIVRHQYPALHQTFQASYEQNLQRRPPAVADRSPLTIRVVVHVVWKNPEENLADSIIHNQIAVLNEDYNRENADTADLRDIFKPAAGNPQIRFELADIVRVKTNANFQLNLLGGDLMANLKNSSQGGSNAWDPNTYMNLWICKIQPLTFGGITVGQILGFAFPPNNLGHWPADSGAPSPGQDGVALDFRVIGRNNPNTIEIPGGGGNLTVRGRTATHEVGHYLGLRHIWGDGGILGLPNDCAQSDGVEDTPFANAQSAFDCDKTRNSCTKIETFYGMDMPDLVENYMDYASEDCMNMFTRGQTDLMLNVLDGPRKSLVDNSTSTGQAASLSGIVIQPNPAREMVRIVLPAGAPAIQSIEVIGADGRVQAVLPPLAPGEQQINLNVGHWAPGWYALRIRTPAGVQTERLMVHH